MRHDVYNAFLVGILVVLSVNVADAATVAREVNRANELYGKGKFEDALEHYQEALVKEPGSALVHYNIGTAQYKRSSYSDSVEHLHKALLTDDPQLQEKVRYNLGNALFKQGIAKESSDLSGAIEDLERSLGQYEKNLTSVRKDPDVQTNYEFVQKELQRLKEKQKQQQEKQQDQQNQQQQNRSDKSKKDDQQNKDQDQKQGSSGDQNKNEPPQDRPKDQNKSDGNNDNSDQGKQSKDDQKPNGDAPKDGQHKKDQPPKSNPGAGETGGQPQDQNSDAAQTNGQGLMTPQEAQMMLDDYQRNDEPKGMMYFKPQSDNSKTVIKDW